MTMIDKAKYLWKFRPFGNLDKNDKYRKEALYSHQVISAQQLASAFDKDKVLSYQREEHRRAVAEKIALAMYEGWMPYDMEWWEGKNDNYFMLREYGELFNDDYHFWTKVKLATWTYPIVKRNPKDAELTYIAYTPESLS